MKFEVFYVLECKNISLNPHHSYCSFVVAGTFKNIQPYSYSVAFFKDLSYLWA